MRRKRFLHSAVPLKLQSAYRLPLRCAVMLRVHPTFAVGSSWDEVRQTVLLRLFSFRRSLVRRWPVPYCAALRRLPVIAVLTLCIFHHSTLPCGFQEKIFREKQGDGHSAASLCFFCHTAVYRSGKTKLSPAARPAAPLSTNCSSHSRSVTLYPSPCFSITISLKIS